MSGKKRAADDDDTDTPAKCIATNPESDGDTDSSSDEDYDTMMTKLYGEQYCDSCKQLAWGEGGKNLPTFEDQTGKVWSLCESCADCCYCLRDTNHAWAFKFYSADDHRLVVTEIRNGKRVFACGTPKQNDDLCDDLGCGDWCDECGLVEADELAFCDLNCKRRLCTAHMGHTCEKCGDDATTCLIIPYTKIDHTKLQDDPVLTNKSSYMKVYLNQHLDWSDTRGEDYMILHFSDKPAVAVSHATAGRLMAARRAFKKK